MMNAQQKHAWFNLVVLGVVAALGSAAYWRVGLPALGILGLLGLWGFGGLFYRKRPGQREVVMDERDVQLNARAWLLAWSLVWLYWGLLCMGPWFWVAVTDGLDATEKPLVRVSWLPLAYMSAMIVGVVAWSVAVLVQHRFGRATREG